jgi:hypothetical protein
LRAIEYLRLGRIVQSPDDPRRAFAVIMTLVEMRRLLTEDGSRA